MSPFRFRPRTFRLPAPSDLGRWLAALRRRRALVALDSADTDHPCARFSLIAFDPLPAVPPPDSAAPADLSGLADLVGSLRVESGDALPGPFHGGFLGALAYDLGVAGERPLRVPPDPWRSPRIVGGLYTDFIVVDQRDGAAWLVLGEAPGDGRPEVAQRLASVQAALAERAQPPEEREEQAGGTRPEGELVRHVPSAEHRRRIECVRAAIARGDLYQANLAHRFTRAMHGDPIQLYRHLREVNPAPYMAYMEWGRPPYEAARAAPGSGFARSGALLSASPELLFDFDGQTARTRPIKGTAPRDREPLADERLARGLLESAKDRAELAMIVDLARNDLGRVARAGTVRVTDFPLLESFASVHHLVGEVRATPRPGSGAFELLQALFPGGSISGAPKLASMGLIAELEGEGRGFFSGSAGFLDTRGRAAFNILIRTMLWRPRPEAAHSWERGEVSYHVGGGITWSSQAEAEDRETLDKGAGLAAALELSIPGPDAALPLTAEEFAG